MSVIANVGRARRDATAFDKLQRSINRYVYMRYIALYVGLLAKGSRCESVN